jgi:hypothetical protein
MIKENSYSGKTRFSGTIPRILAFIHHSTPHTISSSTWSLEDVDRFSSCDGTSEGGAFHRGRGVFLLQTEDMDRSFNGAFHQGQRSFSFGTEHMLPGFFDTNTRIL